MMPERLSSNQNNVPNGWILSTLGNATHPSKKRVNPQDYPELPYVGMENIEPHTMRLLGTVPANQLRSTADSFSSGDVLYGRLRPYLNKVFCANFDGLCSSEFIVFRKTPNISSKYLQYFLNRNEFVANSTSLNSGDRPRVKFEQLSNYPFPIPPLEQQNQIASKIEELFSQLDAGVAGLKRVQELLKQYRASVLKAAFEGRLVPQDPNDEPVYDSLKKVGITPSDAINSNDIPENWLWIKLGDITNTTSGGTPLRSHPEYYGGYIPWLKSGELNDSLLSSTDEYISELGLQKSSAKLFPAGTVVVALYGATVGRTGIMDFDGATNQAVCAVFPLHNLIEEKYLLYWLQSKRQYLISVSAGGAQPNISQGIIRNLEFPLAPINEQKRIISEIEYQLSIISQAEIDISTHVTKASKLRQAVLKAAFEGRLLEQGL